MSYFKNSDYYLEIATSDVAGRSLVHKYGQNPDIDTVSGFEAIWNAGGSYTGHDPTAAETVEVFSSDANDTAAGTGARTVQVYGLDATYAEQTETVTLNGVTAVDTVNDYIRLYRAIVRTAGSGGENAGDIAIRQKVTTANVFALMPAGYNQTMIAAYTVPLGKSAYTLSWFCSLSKKTSATVTAHMKARPFGEVFQVKEEFSIGSGGSSYVQRIYSAPVGPYAAKTDIVVEADTDTNNTGVAAGFDLVLV